MVRVICADFGFEQTDVSHWDCNRNMGYRREDPLIAHNLTLFLLSVSKLAQGERARLITWRSLDRNEDLLIFFLFFCDIFTVSYSLFPK